MKMSHTKKIVLLALLIAMQIVLERYLPVVNTPFLRLSLGFVPVALMGVLFGPIYAGLGAVIADFTGATILFGSAFWGLVITAGLMGITYGVLLHKPTASHEVKIWRVAAAAAIVTIILDLCLNTFWLAFFFENSFTDIIWWRVLKTVLMLPVQMACLRFITGERFKPVLRVLG
ncbi:MAG: folate family ECF transporter S component [Defluviitaleaceae bacterium]|nr:folate family ECF transporter S component [Defluviitaleaceae bacterium]